ncbi:dTMP kinase [Desulfovibrio sp. OttesenSCG-928-C06]|nr:dTMP kinase [Desulfovibrio sp. OttesenSCG-928-C06]
MFITFEGIEGSGKGTMLERAVAWIEQRGKGVLCTREPGGSELGVRLRAILLDSRNSDITSRAELFLYLADRAQHVEQVIRPALASGKVVVSDRYADSTIVYQGFGRGLDPQELFKLNDVAVGGLWPELTLVLDLDVETGLERARSRNQQLGIEEKEGRFEAESLAFHTKVREGYRSWAKLHPGRVRIVDASGTPDEVFARVCVMLEEAGL